MAFATLMIKELCVDPSTKLFLLSDIHDIYGGVSKRKPTEELQHRYRKIDRFARDPGHSGVSPNLQLLPSERRTRKRLV